MPPLPVGSILQNRYRISKILYQSGLTNVYAAEDIHLVGNLWAIKEMKVLAMNSLERQNIIAQFEKEVKKMAQLSHPNVARIIDYFVEGHNLYIIREFIPAYDIGTIMRKTSGPLRERDVLAWGAQIADALHYLYNQKFPAIFFRDLNLANVLVTSEGVVKLIDLGLARLFQTETNPEYLNKMGSMDYAPPEQFEEYGIFDEKSLVYSLGAMLFHMLTAQNPALTPFEIPPVENFNPDVSLATRRIIAKATQYDHRKRYQSLLDMRKDMLRARKNPTPSPEVTVDVSNMEDPEEWGILWPIIVILFSIGAAYLVFKLFFR